MKCDNGIDKIVVSEPTGEVQDYCETNKDHKEYAEEFAREIFEGYVSVCQSYGFTCVFCGNNIEENHEEDCIVLKAEAYLKNLK